MPSTAQQHQALLTIKGHPDGTPMTMGALARGLMITPHAATELVDRLAEANSWCGRPTRMIAAD